MRRDQCAEKGWNNSLALAIQPAHIHLFVRVWPSDSAAAVVKECKGITSFHLRNEFSHLLTLPSMWTRSYFASTAGHVSQYGRPREPGNDQAVYRCPDEALTVSETVRKTYKAKLRPTPAQERALDTVLWRCRDLHTTARQQRITAWQRCPVSLSRGDQEAELKAMRAALPA